MLVLIAMLVLVSLGLGFVGWSRRKREPPMETLSREWLAEHNGGRYRNEGE